MLKRNLISILILSILLVIMTVISNTAFAAFSDVPKSHPFYTYINWLEEQNVVKGYQNKTFKPDENINRAEFLKMLYETMGMKGYNRVFPFADVPSDAWYVKYVKEAYFTGVAQGYHDGSFRPANPINYAEALKIIMNGFFNVDNLYGDGTKYNSCSGIPLNIYPSINTLSWYWKYIHVADEFCILKFDSSANVWKKKDGVMGLVDINPAANISRADMAALLYIAKAVKDNGTIKFNSLTMFPNPIVTSTDIVKCSSIDCLIKLAQSCKKGEVIYSYTAPFIFDKEIIINGQTYFKINGKNNNGLCTFTQQALGAIVTLTEQGRQNALKAGLTQTEINTQIQTISDSMNSDIAIKSITTCTGTGSNIAMYLTDLKQGSYATSCTFQLGQKENHCTVEPNLSCITKMP